MHPDDYRESAALFVRMAPGLARDLGVLAAAGDVVQLRMLAHRLVGTIGFFDPVSSEPARRLEAALAEGRSEDVPALVAAVERELGRVLERLAESAGAPVEGERTRA